MRFFTLAAFVAGASATYTVTQTAEVTITSCGPSVTNCPAKTPGGYGYGGSPPVSPVVPSSSASLPVAPVLSTTSTIYSTSVVTVTNCPSTVTNCPAASIAYTTVIIPVSTTVCPVTAAATPTTVATQYKPTWGQTGGSGPVKPSTTGWYASGSLKPSSSLPAFTGAASHAKAGSFVAGVGVFAALFL